MVILGQYESIRLNKLLGANMLEIAIQIRLNTSSIPAGCVEEFNLNHNIASKEGEEYLLRERILDPLIPIIRMIRDVQTTIR